MMRLSAKARTQRAGATPAASDHQHRRLLRTRRQRPRHRAAEQRDELAPLHLGGHSINSSARSKKASGIFRPSTLAVVRLMTRSNLVGCPAQNLIDNLGGAPPLVRPVWYI